jgi:hypothetical protein
MNYNCRFEAKTVGYFSTTNALGTSLAVILISLVIYTSKLKIIKTALAFLLLSSMARAAIISVAIVYLVVKFAKSSKSMRIIICCFGILAISTIAIYDPLELKNDGSGLSKIEFFESSLELASSTNIDALLFGFGANFQDVTTILGVNDWSPHVPILKALLYFGFIGVLLHLYYIWGVIKLNTNMVYPVFVFIILGFAGAPLYFPTFLTCFAILRASIACEK